MAHMHSKVTTRVKDGCEMAAALCISPLSDASKDGSSSDDECSTQFSRACLSLCALRKYDYMERVGTGVYASVYMGIVDDATRPSAIEAVKVIRSRDTRLAQSWDKNVLPLHALREVHALRSIAHPNVIALLDVYVNTHIVALVLVPYECSLRDVMRRSLAAKTMLTAAQVVGIMQKLLSGVAAVHAAGFAHRDVKPENVLLRNGGRDLVLADFGLSRDAQCIDGDTLTGEVVTLWYAPPEVLCHLPAYGFNVDVFSCGIVLLELCCQGQLSFPTTRVRNQFVRVLVELWGGPAALAPRDTAFLNAAQRYYDTKHGCTAPAPAADAAAAAAPVMAAIPELLARFCPYDTDTVSALQGILMRMLQVVPEFRCSADDARAAFAALQLAPFALSPFVAIPAVHYSRPGPAAPTYRITRALRGIVSTRDVMLLGSKARRCDTVVQPTELWPPQFARHVPRLYTHAMRYDPCCYIVPHAVRVAAWMLPLECADHDSLAVLFALFTLLHGTQGNLVHKLMHVANATARKAFKVYSARHLQELQLYVLAHLPGGVPGKLVVCQQPLAYLPRAPKDEADVQIAVMMNCFAEVARLVNAAPFQERNAALQRTLHARVADK